MLSIKVTVTDQAGVLQPLDSATLQVLDESGRTLTPLALHGCGIGSSVRLLSTCTPDGVYSVRPTVGFGRANPALRHLTVRVTGVTGTGTRTALVLNLEWDF
jgi:hypothetical protein